MLGTNDANPLWWEGERKSDFEGSSKAEFIFQFKKLIAEARELSSQPKVYVATPPPIFPERSNDATKKAMRAARKKIFLAEVLPLVKEVTKTEGAPLIDVHAGLLGDAETCTDGLHFNKKGYTKLAVIIKEQIAAE
jgi:lysophospholipase L1-like esterase